MYIILIRINSKGTGSAETLMRFIHNSIAIHREIMGLTKPIHIYRAKLPISQCRTRLIGGN